MKKQSALEKRLREIEREKARVREQIDEVRHWADSVPDAARTLAEPRFRGEETPGPYRSGAAVGALATEVVSTGVLERVSETVPENETSLDFEPGPDGLDTKRVVMPRLQRTDLLRPAIGGGGGGNKLVEPEYDRFRNYLGSVGLKRVREARRERGSQRIRAIFMLVMVLTLGFILFKMVI